MAVISLVSWSCDLVSDHRKDFYCIVGAGVFFLTRDMNKEVM